VGGAKIEIAADEFGKFRAGIVPAMDKPLAGSRRPTLVRCGLRTLDTPFLSKLN
jgi:hypothetical protein